MNMQPYEPLKLVRSWMWLYPGCCQACFSGSGHFWTWLLAISIFISIICTCQ